MKTKLTRVLTVTLVLVLALVLILGQSNMVYGRSRGLSPARYRALPAPARAIADVARTDLAQEFGVAASRVAVLGVDPVNFADTSLGLIEPGMRYLDRRGGLPGHPGRRSRDDGSRGNGGPGQVLEQDIQVWDLSHKGLWALCERLRRQALQVVWRRP